MPTSLVDWSFFLLPKKGVPVVEVEKFNITALVAEKWWYQLDGSRYSGSPVEFVDIPLFTTGFSTIPFPVVGNGIWNEPSTVIIPNLDDTRTWSQWISWKLLLGLEVSNRGHHFFQHVNRWVLEKRDPCKLNYPVRWLKIILEALWGVSSSTWRIIPGLGEVLVCISYVYSSLAYWQSKHCQYPDVSGWKPDVHAWRPEVPVRCRTTERCRRFSPKRVGA